MYRELSRLGFYLLIELKFNVVLFKDISFLVFAFVSILSIIVIIFIFWMPLSSMYSYYLFIHHRTFYLLHDLRFSIPIPKNFHKKKNTLLYKICMFIVAEEYKKKNQFKISIL
jgi:hypothetical protein